MNNIFTLFKFCYQLYNQIKYWFGLILILTSFPIFAQNLETFPFQHLSVEQGLSHTNVLGMVQDKNNFLWVATADGLCRYDGYGFKVYRRNPYDSTSFDHSSMNGVFLDSRGGLWCRTKKSSLYYYEPLLDKFIRHPSLYNQKVESITEDEKGDLWMTGYKLFGKLEHKTQRFVSYFNADLERQSAMCDNSFRAICQSETDVFWLGASANRGCLLKINIRTAKIDNVGGQANFKAVFDKLDIRKIIKDRKNNLWIRTQTSGVIFYNPKTATLKIYNNENGLKTNGIGDIALIDHQVWIGTYNGGVNILNPNSNQFEYLLNNPQDTRSINDNSIHSLYQDKQGRIWVGTFVGGLNLLDKNRYKFMPSNLSLPNKTVNAIWKDRKNRLWIGTEGGIALFEDGKQSVFSKETPTTKGILNNPVISIFEDSKGRIWVGTWLGGLDLWDEQTRSFTHFYLQNDKNHRYDARSIGENRSTDELIVNLANYGFYTPDFKTRILVPYRVDLSKVDNYATTIKNTSNGELWIGTNLGLSILKPNSQKITSYFNNLRINSSLSGNTITQILEDSKKSMWIGTEEGGLNRYLGNNKFEHYTTQQGLPSNSIAGLLTDQKGNLWISTFKGISRLNIQDKTFKNYDVSDGLQGNQFKLNACFQDKAGLMYFGGTNGLNIFHPDSIQHNKEIPHIMLTDLKIFNKSVGIQESNAILQQHISQTKEITLSYIHSVFSFDFVAINLTLSEKNQYAYMMENFEKDWNYVANQRSATYTNLDAGTYIFRVKASNNDGIWNEEGIKIIIHILPPWWETWWFRITAVSLIILFTVLGFRWRVQVMKAQNIRLEQLVDERTFELQEKNNEVSQQAEELQQQAEELMSQRDFIQAQNQQLAEQNHLVEQTNQQLGEQNRLVEQTNQQLAEQNLLVQEKNQQIRQSINAALTIQKAILPHQKKIENLLGEHFVLYNPKDVVSGDFYWLHKVGEQTILVVADCTGHGVPGAFMTLIGNSLLDKIVRVLGIVDPAEILSRLHQEVYKALKQKYTGNNYGMDAIAINIDASEKDKRKIVFAGAKNSMYYVDIQQDDEVGVIKGTRRAIGGQQNETIVFENNEIVLSEDSLIYLGSDGFIDQNNFRRKRFGTDKFIKLIKLYANLPIWEQKHFFKKVLEEHMQGVNQRDDILLIGFKV